MRDRAFIKLTIYSPVEVVQPIWLDAAAIIGVKPHGHGCFVLLAGGDRRESVCETAEHVVLLLDHATDGDFSELGPDVSS